MLPCTTTDPRPAFSLSLMPQYHNNHSYHNFNEDVRVAHTIWHYVQFSLPTAQGFLFDQGTLRNHGALFYQSSPIYVPTYSV